MKNFYILGSLSLFNLINCALIDSKTAPVNKPGPFDTVPSDIVLKFAEYFENPFPYLGCLKCHIRDSLAKYPVKSLFKRLFPNIPELVTDDVNICEPELRIILPLAKFTDPTHLHEALKYEFIHGNTFSTLLPNLLKYFTRVDTIGSNISMIRALMDRIHSKHSTRFNCLIEYFLANTQYFEHINKGNEALSFETYVDKLVLIPTAKDTFFFKFTRFPDRTFFLLESIWDDFVISKEFYPSIFERMNAEINNSGKNKEYYRILNRIRFGPDEPDFFENELQDANRFSESQQFRLIICASLANKMDLFSKLLRNISNEVLVRNCRYIYVPIEESIELLKVILDIHNFKYSVVYSNRNIYNEQHYIRMIRKYYKITSISWNDMIIEIEFTLSTVSNEDYPVPQIINVNPVFNSIDEYQGFVRLMLFDIDFHNVDVLEKFLPGYFELLKPISEILISEGNLKIIVQSESTYQLLRKFPKRPKFKFKYLSLSNVLDGPVFPLNDIFQVDTIDVLDWPVFPPNDIFEVDTIELKYLMAPGQLKRLETMTRRSISSLLNPRNVGNYLEFRHVFKYLIQTKQGIPKGLNESILSLLRIDFPDYFAKLNKK